MTTVFANATLGELGMDILYYLPGVVLFVITVVAAYHLRNKADDKEFGSFFNWLCVLFLAQMTIAGIVIHTAERFYSNISEFSLSIIFYLYWTCIWTLPIITLRGLWLAGIWAIKRIRQKIV